MALPGESSIVSSHANWTYSKQKSNCLCLLVVSTEYVNVIPIYQIPSFPTNEEGAGGGYPNAHAFQVLFTIRGEA